MGCWFLCTFKCTISVFAISFTRSKVVSVNELFNILFKIDLALLCFWCGVLWLKIEDCIFSVYTSILFLSIGCVTPFLNNDHLNMLDACFKQWSFKHARRLLKSITGTVNILQAPWDFLSYKSCVQTFSSAYEYPVYQF